MRIKPRRREDERPMIKSRAGFHSFDTRLTTMGITMVRLNPMMSLPV